MERLTLRFEGADIVFEPDDTVLEALLRNGERPTPGGTLCCSGDCPNCVATVDGVSYVRTCQVDARDARTVERHPTDDAPPLPIVDGPGGEAPVVEHDVVEVVVVGAGPDADRELRRLTAAGRDVRQVERALGVYEGPRVVSPTRDGLLSLYADEIVVATGDREIQPIVPGSHLAGIVTRSAARRLAGRGIDLGTTVEVGSELLRFVGERTVSAVVVATQDGEQSIPAETVIVDLGIYPRDGLARMGTGLPLTVVDELEDVALPACPPAGVACPCAGVTIAQLDDVWNRGFQTMELLKRATLAGTGTCQGAVCTPYLRSFTASRGLAAEPAFTARPLATQVTMEQASAGEHLPAMMRTALDGVHRALGATMDRFGGWWRPWSYGDTEAEYESVRSAVSLGDVSTLGKMTLTGPDAAATVQRLYPTDVRTIRPGRCRYALMLDERGYVLDDGMICRETEDRFTLTFTTGGADLAETWIRDWSASWGHDIRMLNTTSMTGAINVTGPQAAELLRRVGCEALPGFLDHLRLEIDGIPCQIMRLSFTGEVSYELHHPADRSVALWELLMAVGEPLGVRPHGIEALLRLRLEKGHLLVGQDTEYDSTPRRLGHEWTVDMDSGGFIGRDALLRTNRIPLDKRLVGLTTREQAPMEGAVIWDDDGYSGFVTSSAWSPAMGRGVALGWVSLRDGRLPDAVTIDGLTAHRTDPPFYDPEGRRSRV